MKMIKTTALLLLVFVLPFAANAQVCDDLQLNEAQKKYETGNFDDVFRLLSPCLKSSADAQKREAALRLLALSSFAQDSVLDAKSYVVELLELNPSYQIGIFDPPPFTKAIRELRKLNTSIFVTSVSKKAEDIKLSPGTVLVITADEIQERGYTDLEAIFSDLPGFDISRVYSLFYSNIYQRGYRATNPDRTLLLVDGVEDNDLWNNVFYMSVQYPLSNIKQIEVIYGPASTMYGPNAFAGVINIITKDAAEGDKKLSIHAETGGGTYNTNYFDVYASGKTENVAVSFTARRYVSNLRDLSGFENHNFSADDYDQVDYGQLLEIPNSSLSNLLSHPGFHNFYTVGQNSNGDSIGIANANAIEFARNGDKAAFGRNFNGESIEYSNLTENIYFNGKVQFSNFIFGGQYWRSVNGATNYRTDSYIGAANNGTQLIPEHYFLYGRYKKELIRNKLYVENYLQFRTTSYDDETGIVSLSSYQNGGLSASSLLDSASAAWNSLYLYQTSQQLRNELKVNYVPNKYFDIVLGAEYRNSFIQGNYILGSYSEGLTNRTDTLEPVSQTGIIPNLAPGGNNFKINEVGVYMQATVKINSWLNLIAGSRYDYNKIRVTGGYGSIVNPRLGAIVYNDKYIIKAIYATAFQNASNWTKFSTVPGVRELANPTLPPEKVSNIDISFGYQFTPQLFADVTYYRSRYSGSVFSVNVPYQNGTTSQNQAIGRLNIQGIQANVSWKISNYKLFANYSYADPRNNRIINDQLSSEEERVGDIASRRFNLGLNGRYFKNLNINIRGNYVGERPSGEGTSVSTNPHGNFAPFFLANASIRYENVIPNLHLQVSCNNILDLEYSDPGMRTADGVGYTSEIPQKRRNFSFRVIYDL